MTTIGTDEQPCELAEAHILFSLMQQRCSPDICVLYRTLVLQSLPGDRSPDALTALRT